MYNREYIKSIVPKNKKILEFGPLNSPIADKKTFPNAKYADIKSTDEIKKMYSSNEYLKDTGIYVDIDSIVDIDYVVKTNYKNDIKEKFDVVILSHVIEHMTDILSFFQDVKNILKKDGLLIINYPDKRYCFDHYRNECSFRDAYMTYTVGKKENVRLLLDFYMNVLHENNPDFFWRGKNLVSKYNNKSKDEILKNVSHKIKNGKFEDLHYWLFSDYGFLKFMYDCRRFHLFEFKLKEFKPTQKNTQEFLVILENSSNKNDDLLKLIDKYDPNMILNDYREKIEDLNNKINDYREKIEDLNNKINVLNDQLINVTERASIDNNLKDRKIAELSNELNRILNSKSWKLTSFLRRIKGSL